MKVYVVVLIVILEMTNISGVLAADYEDHDLSLQLLDKLSIEQVNTFVKKINNELHEEIPQLSSETIKDITVKGIDINWQRIWNWTVDNFLKELTANAHLMGKLLFLSILCALLQNLQNSFEQSSIALLSYGICFVFLTVIALTAFYNVLLLARETVGAMVGFMEALLPLLISLLAGAGAVTSAALFTPLMLFSISTVSIIIKDIVLPLLFLTAILECTNYLSEKYQVSNLASLFKQASMVVLGLTLVIFIGVVSIQGAAGSITDGIALRTAKFATATFVPVVGKMFADTVELVMGASLLLKNAIGIFGVMAIMIICAYPLLKMFALIIIIKIVGSLIQPMGDIRMAKCLNSIGDNLLLVFGAVITMSLMFFLAITMIVGAGSIAMMLR